MAHNSPNMTRMMVGIISTPNERLPPTTPTAAAKPIPPSTAEDARQLTRRLQSIRTRRRTYGQVAHRRAVAAWQYLLRCSQALARHRASNHKRHYATLRGETPPIGVAFASTRAALTAILRAGESVHTVCLRGESDAPHTSGFGASTTYRHRTPNRPDALKSARPKRT